MTVSRIVRFFTEFIDTHYGTRLYWLPVFLGLGIGLFFTTSKQIDNHLLYFTLGMLALTYALTRPRLPMISQAVLIILIIQSGYVLAYRQFHNANTITLAPHDDQILWVRATLDHIETREHGHRILISEIDLWTPETRNYPSNQVPRKARVEVRTSVETGLLPGDRVAFKASLHPPPELPAFPGGYDFGRYAFLQQIGAVGYAVSPVTHFIPKNEHISPSPTFAAQLRAARYQLVKHTASLLDRNHATPTEKSIILALLFSERGGIPSDILETIRFAGIGHLLAISGLHMALVMTSCFALLRLFFVFFPRLSLPYSSKKPAAIVSLIAGACYLMLTGAPVSATRAYIMMSIFFLAILIDRQSFSLRPVAIAATIILILDPYALITPSFQMSFAAVCMLIAFFTKLTPRSAGVDRTWFQKIRIFLWGTILSTLVAGIATLPFSVYHFGYTSSYSLPANMIAIPLTTFLIMPMAFLGLLTSFSDISLFFFQLSAYGIDLLTDYVTYLTTPDNGVIYFNMVQMLPVILFTLFTLGLILLKAPYAKICALPAIICFLTLLSPPASPDIILSGGGKLYAIKPQDGSLIFSSYTKERYARAQWIKASANAQQYHMRDSEEFFSNLIEKQHDNIIFHHANGDIAFIHNPQQPVDCTELRLIIQLTKHASSCPHVTTLNKRQLEQQGTHAIWLTKPMKIQSARALQTRSYRQMPMAGLELKHGQDHLH